MRVWTHARWALICGMLAWPAGALAQTTPVYDSEATRLQVLQAEDHRASRAGDLAVLRIGARSRDPQTVRFAVRALGRLERPSAIPDIGALLRHPAPEVRVEAANAIAQAARGLSTDDGRKNAAGVTVESAVGLLITRLQAEAEDSVTGALVTAMGRLPYTSEESYRRAETAVISVLAPGPGTDVRLGVALAGESMARLFAKSYPPSPAFVAAMRDLARLPPGVGPADRAAQATARIRRLAVDALGIAKAIDQTVRDAALTDGDAQVRRILVARLGDATLARTLLADKSPMVRAEAARVLAQARGDAGMCEALAVTARDPEPRVALAAIDGLSTCGASPVAVTALTDLLSTLPTVPSRAWHRAAHAIVSLAAAAPPAAASALPTFVKAPVWQVRTYAARAAAAMGDRATLERLATDADDNVREAAIIGLSKTVGHEADAVYRGALDRGYQVVRVAAQALAGSPDRESALQALGDAMKRLQTDGRDNARDAQTAILAAFESLAATAPPLKRVADLPITADLKPGDLSRNQGARVRVSIRNLGTFDLALFTNEAPFTVSRVLRLADSGYYNGLTFHRFVSNFVLQGGSPGANEYIGYESYMRDEVGTWPHVRGAVGISTRGRDTGDAQIFIDLVDNPRLDHDYTVFAQVLTGMEVVDAMLEGDVIESIERLK